MNRSVLVSGAGSGIGQAIAIKLAERGDKVILLGRTQSKLEDSLSKLSGDGHQIIVADISNRSELESALKDCPPLTTVISNAAVGGENIEEGKDRWDEIININLSGNYYLAQATLPLLLKSEGYKHLVFISSILARLGIPGYSAYCASKSGLLGLMRSLAAEHTANKILVNAKNLKIQK